MYGQRVGAKINRILLEILIKSHMELQPLYFVIVIIHLCNRLKISLNWLIIFIRNASFQRLIMRSWREVCWRWLFINSFYIINAWICIRYCLLWRIRWRKVLCFVLLMVLIWGKRYVNIRKKMKQNKSPWRNKKNRMEKSWKRN